MKILPKKLFIIRMNEGTEDEYYAEREDMKDFDLNDLDGKLVGVYELVETKQADVKVDLK